MVLIQAQAKEHWHARHFVRRKLNESQLNEQQSMALGEPSKIISRRQKVERRMGQLTQAREWDKPARYSNGVLI